MSKCRARRIVTDEHMNAAAGREFRICLRKNLLAGSLNLIRIHVGSELAFEPGFLKLPRLHLQFGNVERAMTRVREIYIKDRFALAGVIIIPEEGTVC